MTADSGRATASPAVRAAYKSRPNDLRLEDLARVAGFPSFPNVHRMLFLEFPTTPKNMERLQRLAEALAVPRGVPLFIAAAPEAPTTQERA